MGLSSERGDDVYLDFHAGLGTGMDVYVHYEQNLRLRSSRQQVTSRAYATADEFQQVLTYVVPFLETNILTLM